MRTMMMCDVWVAVCQLVTLNNALDYRANGPAGPLSDYIVWTNVITGKRTIGLSG